jgi:ethanolamine ammonia-lyase small subunit
MELREAHAAARDAVRADLDLQRDFGSAFVQQWDLFEVSTQARSKDEYLLRPDLGRRLSQESRVQLSACRSRENDVQIVIGDGLSVTAVAKQVPPLLQLLWEGAQNRHWSVGQVFVVRHCRVGLLNEIGELLDPKVAILLIGERPGLATAESLSAYMAHQPRRSHTDADRNLISNIHARGTSVQHAAVRILNLAARMMKARASGYLLREESPALEA